MSARIDLTGQSFGGWIVLSYYGMNEKRQPVWKCRCICGEERLVVAQTLRNGRSRSCGCLKPQAISKAQWYHGHSAGKKESPTYHSWKAMLRRCYGTNTIAYKYYGGRGISVCERWKFFRNFLADMGEKPAGLSLDRIDVNGNYELSNCRWADAFTQRRNQRRMFIGSSKT